MEYIVYRFEKARFWFENERFIPIMDAESVEHILETYPAWTHNHHEGGIIEMLHAYREPLLAVPRVR
jgi:hypothetical protein